MPSPYEASRCGICNKMLKRTNCLWRIFPGICIDCAPPGVLRAHSGSEPLQVSDQGELKVLKPDYWGEWCGTCDRREKCEGLCAPLQHRLQGRMRRRNSVADRPLTNMRLAERMELHQRLYGGRGNEIV